jgi:hypothetical protein
MDDHPIEQHQKFEKKKRSIGHTMCKPFCNNVNGSKNLAHNVNYTKYFYDDHEYELGRDHKHHCTFIKATNPYLVSSHSQLGHLKVLYSMLVNYGKFKVS